MKKVILFLGIIFSIHSSCFAWWDTGHMAIAKIAYDRLSPEAKMQVDTLIAKLEHDFPTNSDPVTCACFADDIIEEGLTAFHTWHGSALPYDPEHLFSQEEIAHMRELIEKNDIVFAIQQAYQTLKNPKSADWSKAFMLRFLIHCVGDIHQPLHCATLYNHHFPEGDRAGTRFKISNSLNAAQSLHSFWDSICGIDEVRLTRPLDHDGEQKLYFLVGNITGLFPEECLPAAKDMDIKTWRDESYLLAQQVAYQGIEPHQSPSAAYIATSQIAAQKQIALAGYRLANLLNDIFQG